MVDNLTSTNVYVEKKVKIDIVCDNTKNSNGVLEIDEKENNLISIIDGGELPLYKVEYYKGDDYLLLYNETLNSMRMVQEGDLLDITLDFEKGLKYLIGAKKVYADFIEDGKFSCNTVGYEIFKIFSDNGREITNYDTNEEDTEIHLKGIDRICTKNCRLVVYLYKTKSSKQVLGSANDNKIVLSYFGYNCLYDAEDFITGKYFEVFNGEEITNFENLSLEHNVEKTVVRRPFGLSNRSYTNHRESSIALNIFLASQTTDIVNYVGTSEFRLILLNNSFGRTVLVNNCKIDDGVGLIYEKEKNQKKLNISCSNFIDITFSNLVPYGKKRYGRGRYGKDVQITNSARRGDMSW